MHIKLTLSEYEKFTMCQLPEARHIGLFEKKIQKKNELEKKKYLFCSSRPFLFHIYTWLTAVYTTAAQCNGFSWPIKSRMQYNINHVKIFRFHIHIPNNICNPLLTLDLKRKKESYAPLEPLQYRCRPCKKKKIIVVHPLYCYVCKSISISTWRKLGQGYKLGGTKVCP